MLRCKMHVRRQQTPPNLRHFPNTMSPPQQSLASLVCALLGLGALQAAAYVEVEQIWPRDSRDTVTQIGGELLTNVTLRNPSRTRSLEIHRGEVELYNGPRGYPLVPTMPASWFSVLDLGGGAPTLQAGENVTVQVAFRPEAALGGALPRLVVTGRVGSGQVRRLSSNKPASYVQYLTYPSHLSVSVSGLYDLSNPDFLSLSGPALAVHGLCPQRLPDTDKCITARLGSRMFLHGDSEQRVQVESIEVAPAKFYPNGSNTPRDAPANVIRYAFGGNLPMTTGHSSWDFGSAFDFDPSESLGPGRYESTLTVRSNATLNGTIQIPIVATARAATVARTSNVELGGLNDTVVVYNSTIYDADSQGLDPRDPYAFTSSTSGDITFRCTFSSLSSNADRDLKIAGVNVYVPNGNMPCRGALRGNYKDILSFSSVSGSFRPGDNITLSATFSPRKCAEYALRKSRTWIEGIEQLGEDEFNGTFRFQLKFDFGDDYAYRSAHDFPFSIRVVSSDDYAREQRGEDGDGVGAGAVAAIAIGLLAGVGVAAVAISRHRTHQKRLQGGTVPDAADVEEQAGGGTYTAL
jgi:hypothetical protein